MIDGWVDIYLLFNILRGWRKNHNLQTTKYTSPNR